MKKNNKFFYGWLVVLGCILITATLVPPIMALSGRYTTYVTADLGIKDSQFTLVNTIVQALGIFLSPMVSKNLAKGNMKKIQSLAIIGFCAGYFMYSFATNVIHLYICAFFVGFCWLNSALIPVSMMVNNWFVKQKGLAMSMAMAGIGVGGAIFGNVIQDLLNGYGWRMTYRIMAVIILVIALPTALFLLKKKPEDMGLVALGADEAPAAAAKKAAAPAKALTLSVKESKGKLFFWVMIMGIFFNGLINTGSLVNFPAAMNRMQSPEVATTVITMYSLIGIGGKIFLGWVNDKFGVIASSIYGCVFFALSFLCIMFAGSSATMLYVMGVVFGLGNAIGTVSPPLVVAEIFGKEKYAEAYGFANCFSQVGMSLGGILVSGIYDMTGSFNPAWGLMFVLSVLTLVGWVGSVIMCKKFKA